MATLGFRDGDRAEVDHVRLDDTPTVLPAPEVFFDRNGVIHSITVRPTGALAGLWTPSIPPGGLRLRGGNRWRPLDPVFASAADAPAGPTDFTWTMIYEYDDGSRHMAESRITVETEAPDAAVDVHTGWIALDYGTSSTSITLFDQTRPRALIGFPRAQSDHVRANLLKALDAEKMFGLTAEVWRRLLSSAAVAVPGGAGGDPIAFAKARIEAEDGLYELLLGLERQVAKNRVPAQTRALHELYSEAFAQPAIREQRMVGVPLHAGGEMISSEMEVVGLEPLQVLLAEGIAVDGPRATVDLPPELRYQRSLKQLIGTGDPLEGLPAGHSPITADDVVAAGWATLVEDKVHGFCRKNPDEFSTRPIVHAVVTYPTVAPPRTRLDVERLARRIGMRQVVIDYDEATAAAMFYLMRDFSGDQAVGIEAFRAHTRNVGDRQWHRNILIIDIGGGTTDIALLGITLFDRTEFADRPQELQGRYYTLRPSVLAKAGRAQLGGDRVTLGIFHHLKAVLADAVLRVRPRLVQGEYGDYLTGGVYAEGSLLATDSRTRQIREDLIEAVVPTRWKTAAGDRQAAHQRFRRLWDVAERAKLRQSEHEGDYVVPGVIELLGLEGRGRDLTEPAQVIIQHTRINAIIEDVVERVFKIALSVVKRRLKRMDNGQVEPLDQVIISGGTSALPQVRRELLKTFEKAGADVNWNPLHVVYDKKFAKSGTSIGACWAEHVRQKGFANPENAVQRVGRGLTELYIDVDNLFHAMPHALALDAQNEQSVTVFEVGAEFRRIGSGGEVHGRRRSAEWYDVTPDLSIFRKPFSPAEAKLQWAYLSLPAIFDAEAPGLDRAAWYRHMKVLFEVNEREMVTAHFCHGGRPVHEVAFARHAAAPGLVADENGVLRTTRQLLVNPDIPGGTPSGGEVIIQANVPLTDRLADGSEVIAGLISLPLPKDVPNEGTWNLYSRNPLDLTDSVHVTTVRAPEPGKLGPDMVAVLDQHGRVTVVPAFVPFARARSMEEALNTPGTVYSREMRPGDPERDEQFNPFNGRQ